MYKLGTNNKSNRDAWLKKVLDQIPPGSRILDAGAGQLVLKPLCEHLRYVSQDFAMFDGKGDGRGLPSKNWDQSSLDIDIICDISAIPQPDGSFDAILCVEVLEHLPEPLLALREFSRLLRSGGHLILTAPFCSLTHMAPYHFYSGFNSYFYEIFLPRYGFEIVEMSENGNFFEYLGQELLRVPSVVERYANSTLEEKDNIAIHSVLEILERFSNTDSRSKDLLCFGYHVFAIKE